MLTQKGLSQKLSQKQTVQTKIRTFSFFLFYFVQLSKIKHSCDRRFQHTVIAFSKRADLIASLIWGRPRGGRCTQV